MLPLVQGLFRPSGRVIGCSHVSGLVVRLLSAAGRYGDTRIGSKSLRRARGAHCPVLVFPTPIFCIRRLRPIDFRVAQGCMGRVCDLMPVHER